MRVYGIFLALIQYTGIYRNHYSSTPELHLTGPRVTDLSVNIKVEEPVNPNSIIVRVCITNEGNQEYRVLRSPNSLFDRSYLSDKFNPVKKDDSQIRPKFFGNLYKWSPEEAVVQKEYTTFNSGAKETYEYVYELNDRYNFFQSGAGIYTLNPTPYILLLDSNNNIEQALYKAQPYAEITIPKSFKSGNQMQMPIIQANNTSADDDYHMIPSCSRPRACPNPGTDGCLKQIKDAAIMAETLARDAFYHLEDNYEDWSLLLASWFGARDQNRARLVRQRLGNLAVGGFSRYDWVCDCSLGPLYAFVRLQEPATVHICPMFWKADTIGADSRAGTIYHEASHFVAGTKDWEYGVRTCSALARNEANKAIENGDSYEYFAEKIFPF